MAAQGCVLLLLNVVKRTFYDHQIPFIVSSSLNLVCFASLHFSHLSSYFINKIRKSSHNDMKAYTY